jgi:putative membrane protein
MKRTIQLAFVGLSIFSFVACEKNNDDDLNDNDRTFMTMASISNTAEVGAGTLAMNKATNAAVRAYGMSMVAEHSLAQSELNNLGASIGHAVKDTLDPFHVTLMAQLNAMAGRAFDSAYIHSQVADHQLAITLFTQEQQNGRHVDVKGYANKYLPHLQMHLTRADSIARAYFPR